MSKRSISTKMILGICLPVLVVFIFAALYVLNTVKTPVNHLTNTELTAKSQTAASQVSEYFTKYIEVTKQMAANCEFENLFLTTKTGVKITEAPGFSNIKKTLVNVKNTDTDNIVVSWIADFDSSQFTQSDGYVSDASYDITTRDWYKQVTETKSVALTEPYLDTASQKTILSIVCPVYKSGTETIIGITGIDLSIDNLKTMMQNHTLGETGFFSLITKAGVLMYYPEQEAILKNITETDMSQNIIDAITNKQAGEITYTAMGESNHGYLTTVGDMGWTVVSGLPDKEFNSIMVSTRNSIIGIFAIGIVLLLILIIFISSGIVKPLKKLTVVANKIADGDLNVSVNIKAQDETGEVAKAISRTVDRLKNYIKYIDEVSIVLNQIAEGNLVFELQNDYAGEFAKIKDSLNNIKGTLTQTVDQIMIAAEQVSSGTEQVSSGAQALAQGATEQASSIEELSASINDVSENVRKNTDNVSDMKNYINETVSEVGGAHAKMQELLTAMEQIDTASDKIGKIIKVIDDIAFQTNILALNAAVEAARAGSAGKGFAVVADEVRNLAGKSADAAQQTAELIQGSIEKVQDGFKIADATGKAVSGVAGKMNKMTESINEIEQASIEQATAITQITQGIEQVSAVVQTNSATAEESAAASEELNSQAKILDDMMSKFTV
ncbi:MAG: methyl-accepting chemotaxis protein [Clostridia bacterium]|jgi:methyl-accepting chemotaxis protein|nr:methyl-accepting chemotaxis protein [Clostridia bacterium]